MPSKIAWKNNRSADTARYSGKDGSERRDKQKKDMYARGLIDSPTEEAMNKYYKKRGRRGSDDNKDSGTKSLEETPLSTDVGSYYGTRTQDQTSSSGLFPTIGNTGASNFYDAATQTGGSNVAGSQRPKTSGVSGSGLPTYGPDQNAQGVQPGTKQFGQINPQQYQSDWQQQIYSPQNAEEAMYNQLADMGVASWDPLVQEAYIPAARGLSNAFTLGQAGQGIGGGQGLPGTDFRAFLGNLLSGGGGGIYGALQNAMGMLSGRIPMSGGSSLVDLLKSGATLNSTGQTIQNPYLASLLPMLSDPSALLQFQQSLASPIFGGSMANALAQAGAIGSLRARRSASQGGLAPGWDYISQLLQGGG